MAEGEETVKSRRVGSWGIAFGRCCQQGISVGIRLLRVFPAGKGERSAPHALPQLHYSTCSPVILPHIWEGGREG
jgi:hypothetical protein